MSPTPADGDTFLPFGAEGVWEQLPTSPLGARRGATGAWVDGAFVVVGGQGDTPCSPFADCMSPTEPALRDGARFDPDTGRWESIAEAPVPVYSGNTAVIGSDLYLFTGDVTGASDSTDFLRYSSDTNAWTELQVPEWASHSSLVAAGEVLMAIPASDEYGETIDGYFDPSDTSWHTLPQHPLGQGFDRHAIWLGEELLLTSKELVSGSDSIGPSVVRLATLEPGFDQWTLLPNINVSGEAPILAAGRVVWPSTTFTRDGLVHKSNGSAFLGGIFTPTTGAWDGLTLPPTSTGLQGYYFLTVGERALVAAHLLNPVTGLWTELPASPAAGRDGATVLASQDTILVWGGSDFPGNFDDGYFLRLAPDHTN